MDLFIVCVKYFCEEDVEKPFQRIRLKNLIGGIILTELNFNLNWIKLPANQISETKLDNKIKIGLERNKIFLGLVFYYVWWKFSDMNL